MVLLVLTVAFVRRPGWFVLAVVAHAAVPDPGADRRRRHRQPAAAALRRAGRRACSRTCGGCFRDAAEEAPREDPRARRVFVALAIVVVLYALQSLYSPDLEHAVKTLGFFYVPFAVGDAAAARAAVVAAARAAGARPRRWRWRCCSRRSGSSSAATGRLLISNEKVLAANELKPYFRVNSLFFDPNVYGRFLALVMVTLAGVLLWAPARRDVARVAVGLARAVGGAGAVAVGVELRGAAGRARRAGGAALAAPAGAGGVRRRRS